MQAEEKIRHVLALDGADRLWKGFGPFGQRPYGWWLERFGQPAQYLGRSVAEVVELAEARS